MILARYNVMIDLDKITINLCNDIIALYNAMIDVCNDKIALCTGIELLLTMPELTV